MTKVIALRRWLSIAVSLALLTSTSQVNAGKLECMFGCELGSFLSPPKWTSTDCHKPYRPIFIVIDTDTFNLEVDKFNRYVADVQLYFDCLEREADQDLDELSDIVSKGIQGAKEEALNDVDSARSSLEFERSLLH